MGATEGDKQTEEIKNFGNGCYLSFLKKMQEWLDLEEDKEGKVGSVRIGFMNGKKGKFLAIWNPKTEKE